MLFRFAAACLWITSTLAGTGPSSLYSLLNGQTFNPPGYTIVMYQSCMQNQNAGNPCGSFTRFETSNGQYSYQLYGPAPCSGSCCREFHLNLACGATLQMSGVNENPTCVYSATLSLPQVCGVDMTVGNEAASVSPSALPPTPTSTPTVTASTTGTNTGSSTETGTATPTQTASVSGTSTGTESGTATPTQTATSTETGTVTPTQTATATESASSTPLFQLIPYPSLTSTSTLTATSTPLFMITAYPTPSPVNVSATSTPLFMYTPYPSVVPNGTNPALDALLALIPPESPAAKILGGVAVGVVAIGALLFTINYFRKGGSVSGFIKKVESQKDAIAQAANLLPISEAEKQKLNAAINDPTSLLPPEAQQAVTIAENANVYKQQAIAALPLTETQKAALTNSVNSLQAAAVQHVQQTSVGAAVVSLIQPPVAPAPAPAPASSVTSASVLTPEPSLSFAPVPVPALSEPIHIAISPEDVAAVQAFLNAKKQATQ